MVDVNLLKAIPFFEVFPHDKLKTVAQICEYRGYREKATILTQGEINTELLFLLEGTVVVFVDKKSIVGVSGDGELFGEVSISTQSPCSATLKAKTDCKFVILNFNKINNLEESLRDAILKSCWHSIARNLSRKLSITNEIANTYKVKYKQATE